VGNQPAIIALKVEMVERGMVFFACAPQPVAAQPGHFRFFSPVFLP
jgi:hypothetical protein